MAEIRRGVQQAFLQCDNGRGRAPWAIGAIRERAGLMVPER
jgi:hypothetical protein